MGRDTGRVPRSDDAMTYVAIHEGTVEFGEKVTDEEYKKAPSSPSRSVDVGGSSGVSEFRPEDAPSIDNQCPSKFGRVAISS